MSEQRQRWRLIVSRGPEARSLAHREVVDAWERALDGAGIPVARSEGGRPRPKLAFAAPVPAGMLAEREPVELGLTERWPARRLRAALESAMPAGHSLVDLFDVWVGAPPVAGQVVASDYRIVIRGVSRDSIEAGAARLLGAATLPRTRAKAGGSREYDLRPLLVELVVAASAVAGRADSADEPTPATVDGVVVRVRLRHDPDVGVGRPDELLLALSEAVGRDLTAEPIVRERLWLTEDPDPGTPLPPSDA